MSKPSKKPTEVQSDAPTFVPNGYTVKRINSGYSVYQGDKKLTEENMWPITMKALERFLRKDCGLT